MKDLARYMNQPTVINIACNVRLVASVPKPGLPNGGPRVLKTCAPRKGKRDD